MTTRPVSAVADRRLTTRPTAGEHQLIPVTVTANERIAEHVQRLSLTAPELCDFRLSGPDEYFGLLMPPAGQHFQPFAISTGNIRSNISAMEESSRPELRWYSVRNLDQHTGTVDVDVVTHGDGGPGSQWVLRAQPGDTAGIYTASGIWSRPVGGGLYVADATSAPALRSILEFVADHHPDELADTHVLVVTPSEGHLEPGLAQEWSHRIATLRIVHTTMDDRAVTVRHLLEAWRAENHPAAQVGYVWACGEQDVAKTARTLGVKEWGLDPDRVGWATYWILGKPRP